MPLERAILALNNIGLTDVLLPFALIFTIIYAVGGQIPQLKDQDRFRVVLALVVALLVVVPHVTGQYPSGLDVVDIINHSIPQVALVIVAIILAIMILGATSTDDSNYDFGFKWLKWIALLAVGLIFLDNINYGVLGRTPFLSWLSDPDIQAIVVIGVVFYLIFWYITGGSGSGYVIRDGRPFRSVSEYKAHLKKKGLRESDQEFTDNVSGVESEFANQKK